jgi:hypothetical protein
MRLPVTHQAVHQARSLTQGLCSLDQKELWLKASNKKNEDFSEICFHYYLRCWRYKRLVIVVQLVSKCKIQLYYCAFLK